MPILRRASFALALFVFVSTGLHAQTPSPVHVIEITAGPGGAVTGGTFVLSEQRSVFNRTDDREVVVLFRWEGVPGPHTLSARWRSPDGTFTANSVIDYVANDRRFGAYWNIAITPAMTLGMWSIEATVDGEPAGRFTFDITDRTVAPGAPVRRALSAGELYERISKSFVLLTRSSASGGDLDAAGGILSEGRVLTASKALDETYRLHAHFPGSGRHELTRLLDLRAAAGWAILESPVTANVELPRGSEPPQIGSRCYSMDGNAAGSRILLEGQITGMAAASGGLMVSFVNGAGTMGAPVVNEQGELLGLLGTTAMPRPGALRPGGALVEFGNMPMIPIASIVPRAGVQPSSFDEARARGELLEPLVGDKHVLSGGFAADLARGPIVELRAQRREFSVTEKQFYVFVTWSPRERLRGETTFRVYDETNRLMGSSDRRKINFRPNELVMSSWQIPVFKQPGLYRVELLFAGKPAWRDYVRIQP